MQTDQDQAAKYEELREKLRAQGASEKLFDITPAGLYHLLMFSMLPMSIEDFGLWRQAVGDLLSQAGLQIDYRNEGHYLYGLDLEKPIDYLPTTHITYIAGPIRDKPRSESNLSLYRCRGCGQSVEVPRPRPEESVLIGCREYKTPAVFKGQWLQHIGPAANTM